MVEGYDRPHLDYVSTQRFPRRKKAASMPSSPTVIKMTILSTESSRKASNRSRRLRPQRSATSDGVAPTSVDEKVGRSHQYA